MSEERIVELETVAEDEKPVNHEDNGKVLGLYDKPVIIEGRRERKSVDFFREEKKEKLGPDYSLGQGVRLGDVPIIEYNLVKVSIDYDLRILHSILYRRPGQKLTIKRNIRDFCGWPFEKDSKEYNAIRSSTVARMTVASLKWTLDLLAIGRSGKDSAGMKEALCEYLLKPCQNEKQIPQKKKRKTKSKTPKRKSKKMRPKNKEKEKKREASAKPKDAKKIDNQKANNSVVSEPSGSSDNSDSEEEEQKPKKTPTSKSNVSKNNKVKKSPTKKAPREDKNHKATNSSSDVSEPSDSSDNSSDSEEEEEKPKKTPASKSNHNKNIVKKPPIKKAPEEGSNDSSDDKPSSKRKRLDSSDSSDDDEPLSKMTKKPPTDAELKTLVSAILKGADLDQVTMKSVIKQVYAKFPSFDLTPRKAVIKGYVKELVNK